VIDVALTEGSTGLLLPALGEAHDAPNILDGTLPCYRVYACSSGAYALGALEPKFWRAFCAGVDRPDWLERGFDPELTREVDVLFASRTRDDWDAALRNADCCGEPVLEPHELRGHPLFAQRGLFVNELPRTFPALVATSDLPRAPAPARGEHTAEILRDWTSARR
jgi:crotonobetainyl-CoA:carnitine CoA-transferase CaiB-like acyl-CoA transferase